MKKIVFFSLFFLFSLEMQAQTEPDIYSALAIPKELLKDAHAVVRRYDVGFTIKDIGTAVETEHKIVTILNEEGKHYGEAYFGYSKIREIDDIEAAIYDASGKLVRKMKRKDIDDFKPYAEDISDTRVKRITFPHLPYPYTVEYTVTTVHKGLLHYPGWNPQNDNRTAVQSSTFEVTVPNDMPALRYKLLNGASEPTTGLNEKGKRYLWTLSKLKAFANEPFTPSSAYAVPEIILAPTDFKVEGFTGNMKTWQSLGAFLNKLGENRTELSAEKKAFLKELVADCPDIPCKVDKIYSHLQATTRYFSIQLGIGGWQPFAATDVEKRKYSDCKGLSNYMVSMLKAVGVQGQYVIIRAGEDEKTQFEDFPNAHFNHAIACVPMKNDTIWLECTSQSEACGFMGSFTNDRMALLVTPEGGKVVHTPVYDEKVNFIHKTGSVKVGLEGGATTEATIIYSGIKQGIASQLTEINADTRKKYVYETLKIDNATINEMTFSRKKTRIPIVEQKLNLTIEPLASKSGKRLFLPVNVFSKFTRVPSADSTRLFQVQADENGFTEQDSVTFQLPEGYKSETKPTPLSITSPFGSFEMTLTEKSPTELVFYRKFILNNKILPKEKFPELVEFLKNVAKADKGKLILVKTTS
jgi:Domain of Unknown Function with PDB structure (DUF3857)